MASYTENILLTLRDHADPVEVESFNRDNEIIDKLLAPVAEDYAVIRSAARINAYNTMKAIRAATYAGIAVPEKIAMFFGDFDSAAYATSENALHCPQDHGYQFSRYQGDSYACGEAGDVATTLGSDCTFNFEAPVSGYLISLEVDVQSASPNTNCYLMQCWLGDAYLNNTNVGNMTGIRSMQTLTFNTPIAIHKGDILSGKLVSGTAEGTGYLYSAALGAPYVKFNIIPATQSGWVQTGINSLGIMGHSEARVYIQCLKDENGKIGASLIDEEGDELVLEQVSSRTTVTKNGNACIELGFTAPYSKEMASLKINVDAGDGYVDVYNYAVTVL